MSSSQAVRIAVQELYRELPGRKYRIESTGNGAFYTLTRLSDGETRFIQDESAAIFGEALDATNSMFTDDDLADEYFA